METESGAELITPAHVRHIMRYVTACQFIEPGTVVLDAACGAGYGTSIIHRHTQAYTVGMDFNEDAINYAETYYAEPDVLFQRLNLLTDIEPVEEFPAIVGIETIEHFSMDDIKVYLWNMRNALKPRGTFIVSTPYCTHSGPSPITKQHMHEFSLTDFEMMLNDAGFSVHGIYPRRHEGKAGRLGYCMAKAIKR